MELYLESHQLGIIAVKVIPDSYEILSAAVYEDPACEPPSSSMRGTPNSPVTCFPSEQATGATPRLTDGVLGPDNLTSNTTDYAYTLAGKSPTGTLKVWIQFEFFSRVSLASVTLHYYCTGQSPQFQLSDGSSVVVAPPVSPPCDSTAQRQCFTFNVSTSTMQMNLKVLRNDNIIYISEVKFIEGQPSGHVIVGTVYTHLLALFRACCTWCLHNFLHDCQSRHSLNHCSLKS